MHLVLVGTSHHLAPVELRERLAFDDETGRRLLARLLAEERESVALSTCNRVCLYLADVDAEAAKERGLEELAALADLEPAGIEGHVYVKEDEAAALHLFRVAAGLDSLVPGEAQILGQVREAFETAAREGSTGPVLHRLFRQALHAGRRVRTETRIGETPTSVSSAAADLAARVFDDLPHRSVLLIGAGKMGALAAASLVARGTGALVVANRSLDKAQQLAARFGGTAMPLQDLGRALDDADVVVASTGSEGLVLTAADVDDALRRRRGRPIFFIDIAVPRDLDPAINELAGCYLYDIDDLERVVAGAQSGLQCDSARAEAIAADEARRFAAWQRSLDVVPAISSLRRRAEEIREAELSRARAKLAALSPRERDAVESVTVQIVNKLLHLPTVRLKEAAAGADGAAYAETVRDLFDLRDDDASR
jgi:glutamyl-tRNA reductase